ncbi:hypothetical protein FACS189427_13010 [Planctomycetales bacterium]|nr:hypothetical protein FACS189427_13010 [Planctomycetales bacterium]
MPVQPAQAEPIRIQPIQMPPRSITQNGVVVYQDTQGTLQPVQVSGNRSTPAGFNSPFPADRAMPPAANNSSANYPQSTRQQVIPQQGTLQQGTYPQGTLLTANAQINSAQGNPAQGNPAQTGDNRTDSIPNSTVPNNSVPNAAQYIHRGHDEPASRVIPFTLAPQEEAELNEFLVRWEKYSEMIKRYEIDFTSYYYDPAVQRPNPADAGKPVLTTFGFFKYVAPSKFVFNVEGEWVNGKKVVRDKQGEDEQPKVYGEKITIDEKSVYYYDYNAKTVKQIDIPPEMLGKGIADSPLPLIFGAKADDMKKRFYLKLVTAEQVKDSQVWLQARPRLADDRQEFSQIEIRLDKKTLRAVALKKDDINGKAHTVYVFNDPKVNDLLGFDKLRDFFTPAIPRGWKHTVETLPVMNTQPMNAQVPVYPNNQPVQPNPVYGNPNGGVIQPAQNNEIQLYSPK